MRSVCQGLDCDTKTAGIVAEHALQVAERLDALGRGLGRELGDVQLKELDVALAGGDHFRQDGYRFFHKAILNPPPPREVRRDRIDPISASLPDRARPLYGASRKLLLGPDRRQPYLNQGMPLLFGAAALPLPDRRPRHSVSIGKSRVDGGDATCLNHN
jgi:hypothetical protein